MNYLIRLIELNIVHRRIPALTSDMSEMQTIKPFREAQTIMYFGI